MTGQWVVDVFQLAYSHPWATFFFLLAAADLFPGAVRTIRGSK